MPVPVGVLFLMVGNPKSPLENVNKMNYKGISIEECYSIRFYHLKKLLYQLYYTILQYTLHPKTLLFYFFIKIFFFNLFLLFLSHHHFFSAKGWNKFFFFFSIVLQYNSKFRIVLYHYCKNFCNSEEYYFLMQIFFNYKIPKRP